MFVFLFFVLVRLQLSLASLFFLPNACTLQSSGNYTGSCLTRQYP